MLKSNRLLSKLIEASGGWENFLYETLKKLCKDVTSLYSVDGVNRELQLVAFIEEAMEILEAYEEQQDVELVNSNSIGANHAKITSGKKEHSVSTTKKMDKPVQSKVKPKLMQTRVGIDKEAGASRGQLPIPAGWRVVNKELIIISKNRMELGRGSKDGQILGRGVSGHVSNKGDYRLVFKEVTLGDATINYEILPIPPAPVEIRPPAPVGQQVQVTPAMVAAKAAVAKEAAKVEPVKAVPIDPPRNADGSNVKQTG